MTTERISPRAIERAEFRSFDIELIHAWEIATARFEEYLGALETPDDLIDFLKTTNGRRFRAKRRRDRILSAEHTDRALVLAGKFDHFKDVWSVTKDKGMLLAIMLRSQGANWVKVSLRDLTPEEVDESVENGRSPSPIVLVSIDSPNNHNSYHTRGRFDQLAKLIPEEKLNNLIGTGDPWPEGVLTQVQGVKSLKS